MTEATHPIIAQLDSITMRFGGVYALTDVTFSVKADQITALIGPNGAGKTTLINCMTGFLRPSKGKIMVFGQDVTQRRAHQLPKLGIVRTFQGIQLIDEFSVIDNLLLGRHAYMNHSIWRDFLYWPFGASVEKKHLEQVEAILNLLDLVDVADTKVGGLGYGIQKKVDLGRALLQQPKLLLMDEPMAGMNAHEKADMSRLIRDIRSRLHISIVLIEHDIGVVMELADEIIVLDWGRVIGEGTPQQIRSNVKVIEAYLGVPAPIAI